MSDLRDTFHASLGDTYTFERELGGGGMSRVFVAEEKALGRRVVVKVLPAELSGGVSIARFQREISLAARLQHPHIVPLLAAGEFNGLPYYTMPLVDGESLRDRLTHGSLPIGEAVSILRDVAKALDFAHRKGVAHRDIKPDNVLLAGTSAVITDFGVAKALSDAAAETGGTLTSVGVALGTPAYMAPEQAAADPATDLRADVYAFGAMAYEMLAGHVPFAGRSAQAMLAAHATEAPMTIATLRPATPPALADLVMRCLAKMPADRPQSAAMILQALDSVDATGGSAAAQGVISTPAPAASHARARPARLVAGGVLLLVAIAGLWWRGRGAASTGGEIRSIAVLPFVNTSRDSTLDYLEDGITDHVRDALNAIPELAVKARGSSQHLKGRSAREIGDKLGVAVVLQGTFTRAGGGLHLTTELVRTSDDNALWSGTFDGQASEIAGMQDTITRAVTRFLHAGRAAARSDARGTRGTTDADAYLLFLQGRFAYDHFDFARAVPLFEQALAKDPQFALAQAYIANSHAIVPVLGSASLDSALALARAEADRALALDSSVVMAYIAQAGILAGEMRLVEGLRPLEHALAIDSTNADVMWTYGLGLAQVGRVPEAFVQLQRARQRDPLSQPATAILSYVQTMLGRYDEAIAMGKAAVALDPTAVLPTRGLGLTYIASGKPDSAVVQLETAFRLGPAMLGTRAALIVGYAAAGRWAAAKRERAALLTENRGNSPNYERAMVALAFSEFDAAMTYLERAVANREAELGPVSIPCDPLFDPLKGNPRFAVLVQRHGAQMCPARGPSPIKPPPK